MGQLKKYLAVILGIAIMMVLTICAASLYEGYRQTSISAVTNANNVTLIVQRAISRNMEILSLAMDTLAYRYQHPLRLAHVSEEERHVYLFDSTATARHITALAVLDADGYVRATSRRSTSPQVIVNYSERAYFTVHRDRADVGLFISRPISASLGNELPVVVMSKRLSRKDGSFDGVVVMALDMAYFRDLFSGLALGEDGVISLYSDDGVTYMRVPYDASFIGREISNRPNFQRLKAMLAENDGSFFARSGTDGEKRLYTFRRIPDAPLIVLLGRSERVIFKNWYETLYSVLLLLIIFSSLAGVLLLLVRRELVRRVAAEKQLEGQARTDGLTGLLNRRALDEVLLSTWQRSQRSSSTYFSTLFIDVDYFKLYNDTYGHKMGDTVLQAVATVLRENLRRQNDRAGRYGGEEFVVLLEQTNEDGALLMAQRLCEAIYSQRIAHSASPLQVISISIGVATLNRERHQRMEDVLNDADNALYLAKRDGRNRVCAAHPSQSSPTS